MPAALEFPRWVYVPGEVAEPDHDPLVAAKALVPARFEGFVPAHHPALIYGLALNDAGFFWESHEVLEAVWIAAPQGGRDRIALRACIQIANAGLKAMMKRTRAVQRLLEEALAELDELAVRRPASRETGSFADRFPAAAMAFRVREAAKRLSQQESGPVEVQFGAV